jgi:hypothetical protein
MVCRSCFALNIFGFSTRPEKEAFCPVQDPTLFSTLPTLCRVATFHGRRVNINQPLTVFDYCRYLIPNRLWRNNDSPLHRRSTCCPPQYIQTIPLSRMVVSGKVMATRSLPGPSGDVPKMAITVFTKMPTEHLEERKWPTVYGPARFSLDLEYRRMAARRWGDGEKLPEWVLPDPPSG